MKLKKTLLFLILLLLCFPILQGKFRVVKEKPVAGYFKPVEEPSLKAFKWAAWEKGSFQDEFQKRVTSHMPFRPALFRINCQLDYSLFGLTHADGFVKGQKSCFFQDDYIFEYNGKFFIGRRALQKKLWKLKDVQDHLSKLGIPMLLVLEPGKASYFPEYIPGRLPGRQGRESNYHFVSGRLDAYGIHNIDLNRWFMLMKDTSGFPLFPKYGMHWSVYGEQFSLDTVMRGLEKVSGKKMPSISITGVKWTDSLHETDYDIGNLLNLIFSLKKVKLPYPDIRIDRSGVDTSMKVLVIADSYYETILRDVKEPLFPHSEFWFYNSKLFPYIDDYHDPVRLDKSDIISRYKKFNMILLMVSEINMHSFLWNFMDEAYEAFHPAYTEPPEYFYENACRNYRDWFKVIANKAEGLGRPLELQLHDEAVWMAKKK